ncbi:MAG: hypothetical protein IRZ32_13425 [Solirubrobacteraceae bacterium]|nr:hypothetical protein [Solirubrobacteraceae bacterium]
MSFLELDEPDSALRHQTVRSREDLQLMAFRRVDLERLDPIDALAGAHCVERVDADVG